MARSPALDECGQSWVTCSLEHPLPRSLGRPFHGRACDGTVALTAADRTDFLLWQNPHAGKRRVCDEMDSTPAPRTSTRGRFRSPTRSRCSPRRYGSERRPTPARATSNTTASPTPSASSRSTPAGLTARATTHRPGRSSARRAEWRRCLSRRPDCSRSPPWLQPGSCRAGAGRPPGRALAQPEHRKVKRGLKGLVKLSPCWNGRMTGEHE